MMKRLLRKGILLLIGISPLWGYSQVIYNLNNQDLNFGGTGVTIVYKVGTGTTVGDIVLYENVVTIGAQQIDAIVRTVALTGTMTNFDNPSTSGPGMSNNQARFFSPQFSFSSGGGSAQFVFEFISGGSYNNTTNTGTIVGLSDVLANTYDIDGNGGFGSNQYNEYGGFDTVALGNPTNVGTTYNLATGLTKFRSNSSTNVFNVLDDRTRVHVGFPVLTTFTFVVGADGSGAAYFFIDFGSGATWSSPPDYFEPPTLDLDTLTTGINNLDTFCINPVYFSGGNTNIESGGTIDRLQVGITSTEIIDGADEKFVVAGATGGDTISWNFTHGQIIPNFTFKGNTYSVAASVANGESTLDIVNNSGTMTEAECEELIDSLLYVNWNATTGLREFDIYLVEGPFASLLSNYQVNVNCGILPVDLMYFTANPIDAQSVLLTWATANEFNNDYFVIERSSDAIEWEELETIDGRGYSSEINTYAGMDYQPFDQISYYRLKQVDYNTDYEYSDIEVVTFNKEFHDLEIRYSYDPNTLYALTRQIDNQDIRVYNMLGTDVSSSVDLQIMDSNKMKVSLSELPKGVYVFKANDQSLTIRKL
ncbi:MAG: T9SS type A sorting domain-containing protein [Bacteroidia bacterium]